MTADLNLGGKRLRPWEHDEERARAGRESAEQDAARLSTFPVYDLPGFVRERLPDLVLDDPSTWPETDRCTDGRPYGHNAYSFGWARESDRVDQWRRYLVWLGTDPATRRRTGPGGPCRNRWKHEESRLCGTHHKPWEDNLRSARTSARRYSRIEQHLDLAKQLAAHGIESDGSTNAGVVLQADAVRALLDLLASVRIEEPAPTHDPSR